MNCKQSSDMSKSAPSDLGKPTPPLEPSRREFLVELGGAAMLTALSAPSSYAQASESPLNIARVAIPTSQMVRSEDKISALNDGFIPENSFDRTHALYALWAEGASDSRASWVQYEWSEPVSVNRVEIYWA